MRKIHVIAANESASVSLVNSRGEEAHHHNDKDAIFWINHYVWETKNSSKYEIRDEELTGEGATETAA